MAKKRKTVARITAPDSAYRSWSIDVSSWTQERSKLDKLTSIRDILTSIQHFELAAFMRGLMDEERAKQAAQKKKARALRKVTK